MCWGVWVNGDGTGVFKNDQVIGLTHSKKVCKLSQNHHCTGPSTMENQAEIMDLVQKLSVRAIEVLVADNKVVAQNFTLEKDHVIVQKDIFPEQLDLSDEVRARLLDLQKKGLDLSKILIDLLDEREAKLEKEMYESLVVEEKASRYIPVKIRKILKNKYGKKCAVVNCYKEAKTIHHDQRFSILQRHSVFAMRPLCDEHHQLTHLADLKYFEYRGRVSED